VLSINTFAFVTILSGDFHAEVRGGNMFKPTAENYSLHEITNDIGVKLVNFAISKCLIATITIFPNCNIHKFNKANYGSVNATILIGLFRCYCHNMFQS
jgi:hypothetical protein